MSYKQTSYVAKQPDANGIVHYTNDENAIWHDLITRQMEVVKTRACPEYLHGLKLLNLSEQHIPQCQDVSKVLYETTGWVLEPVSALIPFEKFFDLLANRRFPAATFIRHRDELDYLEEPDIFHEIFGHCPLLTNRAYADFTHTYGQLALHASKEERAMLARLYWFTIEFGLIKSNSDIKIYGGGILSSYNETLYCLEKNKPQLKPFDVLEALRTPYRIDVIQPTYFVLDNFNVLYDVINMDLLALVKKAVQLGVYDE